MNHEKIVVDIKTLRETISVATSQIAIMKTEAFDKIEGEKQTLQEQLKGLKVSKKEVSRA
jgi:archaellum component FlaC